MIGLVWENMGLRIKLIELIIYIYLFEEVYENASGSRMKIDPSQR